MPVISPKEFETAETFGVGMVEHFTWKQLMDGDACTRCGRCQDNCPAYLTEKPLSPKKIINDVKDAMDDRIPKLMAADDPSTVESKALIGEYVLEDEIWSCTNCAACMENCPVQIEHVPKIIDMRRYQVLMEGKMATELQTSFGNMENNSNPYGFAFAARADWIPDDLGVKTYNELNSKRNFGNTLDGQIKKYGKEEGTRRYDEMNSKKVHTLENFIRKHGNVKGKEMYESTMAKKCMSLEKFQNKYGIKAGTKRWNEWKSKCISTEENFIKRHGEKLGKQKWQDFKDKSKSTKENFIKRHGKVEGEKRWKNYKENYGWTQASQQSLEIFEPLTKQLLEKGIDFNDIFYGVENSFEFKIENDGRLYSYDYTILSLKIIFEFNGSHVHPSKEKLGEAWNTWKNAWTGENADTKYAQDQHKIKIAEKEGFTVIEIWDYEDRNKSLNNCLRLVEERI